MKTLDLHRIWEILNLISDQEYILNDKDIYPSLLGGMSNYYNQSYSHFLSNYSFRIDEDEICIFNNEPIPYEYYNNEDYSYIPKELLDFDDTSIINWVDEKTKIYLSRLEENKKSEKENLKIEIKRLTEKLNKL